MRMTSSSVINAAGNKARCHFGLLMVCLCCELVIICNPWFIVMSIFSILVLFIKFIKHFNPDNYKTDLTSKQLLCSLGRDALQVNPL